LNDFISVGGVLVSLVAAVFVVGAGEADVLGEFVHEFFSLGEAVFLSGL